MQNKQMLRLAERLEKRCENVLYAHSVEDQIRELREAVNDIVCSLRSRTGDQSNAT